MFPKTKFTALLLITSFAVFSLAAIFITYPLIFNLNSIISGFGDELVITWIQNFIIQHPFTFNANIYLPYKNTLAYSDFLFTSSIISAPFLFLFRTPIITFNFTLITSFILLGFSIFLLAFYVTKNYLISILVGIMVIFSPAVLDKKIHLQILGIEWVVFSIIFFLVFLENNKRKYLITSLIFFDLQIYNSFMPGYFILFFYFISLLCLFIADKSKFKEKINRKNILLIIVSLLIVVPIVIPYFRVSQEFKYKRDIRETIHFALQPEDFLVTSSDSKFNLISNKIFKIINYPKNAEIKNGFLGITFSILTILFVIHFIKKFNKKNYILNSFFFTGVWGFLLSLGPFLHLNREMIHHPIPIPLPYLLTYYLLPGFNGFRNSARWEMLFIICFSVGISIMLKDLLQKFSINKQFVLIIFILISIIVEFNFPLKYYSTNVLSTPKVYSFLNKDSKVLFVPFCSWNDQCANLEFKRNYYSINNFPITVNGVSGFSPPPWEKFVYDFNKGFPNDSSLKSAKSLGLNYLIFEKDSYDQFYPNGQKVLDALRNNRNIREIKRFDNTYVFQL